jgi:cell division transport system permease protein
MLTNFKRIYKFAINDFARNKGISVAAIFVLFVTIMLVTSMIFFQGMASYLIQEIQGRIDITAYFKEGTAEQDILNVKNQILGMSAEIKNVEYVSQEQALTAFNEKHKDNPVLAKAVQEVGGNPFLPSLNIITNGDPKQYEDIANLLQTSDFGKLIEKVDFSQKKDTIEKVYSITKNINTFGLLLGAILIIVAILVVFNTVRLAVESSKDEIATMKIVGASDWFVRGPFIIQGVIYGIIAFVACFVISGILSYFLSSKISVILPGFNIFSYFLTNWWFFVLIQLGFGIGVGAISSFVVVKRHLKS